MVNWDLAKNLSGEKLTLTTSIWVFLVPIMVKLTDKSNDIFDPLKLEVPLNFYILYFLGVSIFIGCLVYKVFCPSLIKLYNNFYEFNSSGNTANSLSLLLKDTSKDKANLLRASIKESTTKPTPIDTDNNLTTSITLGSNKVAVSFLKEELNDVFWLSKDHLNKQRFFFIAVSIFFHILGYTGLAYLFLSNIYLIITSLFN